MKGGLQEVQMSENSTSVNKEPIVRPAPTSQSNSSTQMAATPYVKTEIQAPEAPKLNANDQLQPPKSTQAPPAPKVQQPPKPVVSEAFYASTAGNRSVLLTYSVDMGRHMPRECHMDASTKSQTCNNHLFIRHSPTCGDSPSNPCDVILVTSTKSVSWKYRNTLRMLSLFQKSYSFKAIVFTSTAVVNSLCRELGILTLPITSTNQYGMPIVKQFFIDAKSRFSSLYYGFINSDILLSPSVFSSLSCVYSYMRTTYKDKNYVAVSRVYNSDYFGSRTSFSSINDYYNILKSANNRGIRNVDAIDIFFYSSSFPFNTLLPVVIARFYVDTEMAYAAHRNNAFIIDLTYSDTSYHQGMDNAYYRWNRISRRDFMYNRRMMAPHLNNFLGSSASHFQLCRL